MIPWPKWSKDEWNQRLNELLSRDDDPAMEKALHYKTTFQGLDISIENRAGSVRSGVSHDGTEWAVTMTHPYGYIRMTQGVDGDHVDCFIGPNPYAENAYVIHALRPVLPSEIHLQECLANTWSFHSQNASYMREAESFLEEADELLAVESKSSGSERRISSAFESFVDSRLRDSKLFGDGSNRVALFAHLHSIFQVPQTWLAVKAAMVSLLHDVKVRRIIIKSVPIDMVNYFAAGQLSSDDVLHNYPMLQALSAFVIYQAIQRFPTKTSDVSANVSHDRWKYGMAYDECKVMLGFDSEEEAKQAFLENYSDPRFYGGMHIMPMEEFKEKALATKDQPAMIKANSAADNRAYLAETARIRENQKKPENQQPHAFEKAEWTWPNAHPRCLRCGYEEPESGMCSGETLLKTQAIAATNGLPWRLTKAYVRQHRRIENGKIVIVRQYERDQNDVSEWKGKFVGQVYWHGSPSGDLRGGRSGLHLGTKKAAEQALNARIGIPADGKGWMGDREYGKTLLAGKNTLRKMDPRGYLLNGHNMDAPDDDYYAESRGLPKYSDGTSMKMTDKPSVEPFIITGPMTNSEYEPMSDTRANASMTAQITRYGKGKRGYFYVNDGEDSGSVSVVVPDGSHLKKLQ